MSYKGEAEILPNQTGKIKLHFNGYYFHKDKAYNDKTFYWECDERKSKNCNGRLTTHLVEEKHMVMKSSDHTHDPSPHKKEAVLALDAMTKRAISTEEDPSTIIRGEKRKLDSETKLIVPNDQALTKKIKRARYSIEINSYNSVEFEVPASLSMINGEEFLIGDDFNNRRNERILIFSNMRLLELMCEAEALIMDGTFKSAPLHFTQIYTIHATVKVKGNRCLFSSCPHIQSSFLFYLFFRQISQHSCSSRCINTQKQSDL